MSDSVEFLGSNFIDMGRGGGAVWLHPRFLYSERRLQRWGEALRKSINNGVHPLLARAVSFLQKFN